MRGIALILGRTDPSITVTPQQPWPHCIWPMGLTRASILILARARLRLSLGMRRPARPPPPPTWEPADSKRPRANKHGNQRIPKGPEHVHMCDRLAMWPRQQVACVCGDRDACAATEMRVRVNECMRVCAATVACVCMSPPPPILRPSRTKHPQSTSTRGPG
jgi:hypothetical protein